MKKKARLCEKPASAARVGITAMILVSWLLLGPLTTDSPAASTWLSPQPLSPSEAPEATRPQVAIDSQGDSVAVWQRHDGGKWIIEAATRPAGGTWQTPVEISTGSHGAENPAVAIDPQGEAVAVWWRYNGAQDVIEAATLPAGSSWQPPVEISPEGQSALEPEVAFDSQGNAVAVWASMEGGHWIAEAADRPAGGTWQAPVDISPSGQSASEIQVALNAHGDTVVVWHCYFCGPNFMVEAASRPAGGAWQAPVELSAAGGDASHPQVALDSQGNAVAVWQRENAAKNEIIEAASFPAGGTWQAPVELSPAGHNAFSPQVAFDSGGAAVAAWERSGTNEIIEAVSRPAGGAWQTPAEVSPTGQDAFEPQVALDPEGDAVAVWWSYSEGGAAHTIEAAILPAGGSWQPAEELSTAEKSARFPHVAIDSQGDAVAVWEHEDGGNWIVEAAGYDGGHGPVLQSLSMPSTGVVGQPLEFSVSPLDVWSGLGKTDWSFGDGSLASGTSATHTYATPGQYPITLTSADALGNTTSASGEAMIIAAPPHQEGPKSHHAPSRGTASVARLALVKKGRALLRMACGGAGPCQGVVKLIHPKAHKSRLLGKAAFSIPAGERRVVRVKLKREGRTLIRRAGRHSLKVRLMGPEMRGRTVVLKEA